MIRIRKIRQYLVGSNDDVGYSDLFETSSDISQFTSESVSLVYMKLVNNQPELKGFSKGLSKIDKKKIGGLIFSAVPQKHAGVASKIHVLESAEQVLLCYVFTAEARKSPTNGSSPSSRNSSSNSGTSPNSKLSDLDQSGTEDELQSSVTSLSSISSGFGSFMQSLGFPSFNNHRPSTSFSSATPPPYSSSIPTEFHFKSPSSGLKRTYSSPCKLSAEVLRKDYRRNQLGLAIIFSNKDFQTLKKFVLENYVFIETQAMKAVSQIKQSSMSLDDISTQFIEYLNVTLTGERMLTTAWQSVNFSGLVGSREMKDKITDIICKLYDRYERERCFISTVVTSILSATSLWHSHVATPNSIMNQRIYETYGGISPNFPIRIAFIAKESNLLEKFLILVSYFQRNSFMIKSKRKDVYMKAHDGKNMSLSDLNCCGYGDSLYRAFNSAINSNAFFFFNSHADDDNCDSDPTLTSSSMSDEPSIQRYSTAFTDHYLNRKLYADKLIVRNKKSCPIITQNYHPSLPVIGILNTDDIYDDSRSGFTAFHDSVELSNVTYHVSPRMIINNIANFDCKIHMRGGGRGMYDNITSASYVRRILKNFNDLRRLTGNSKLCLIYLESELETLGCIKDAYLTFCQLEESPPEQFLNIFGLDHSDKAMFHHYL